MGHCATFAIGLTVKANLSVCRGPLRTKDSYGSRFFCEHAVFELPTGYGDNVRYFKMIDSAEALVAVS
jgi:hypothetical protein